MKNILFLLIILFLFVSAKNDNKYYNEKLRPQFHFSPEKDWMYKPNGLTFFSGEYHLFYQNITTKNKLIYINIGHASSKDLIEWKHLPDAFQTIDGDTSSVKCRPFSGSVIVDSTNYSGLGNDKEKAVLLYYTDKNGSQSMAYSKDKGLNWIQYPQNPVLKTSAIDSHDPKVFFHAPSGKWVMLLYQAKGPNSEDSVVNIFNSADLLRWEYQSQVKGIEESPDLFELPFDGKSFAKKWVLLSGEGDYLVGSFDGKSFLPETDKKKLDFGRNFFAAQTMSNPGDGKIIQIAWMRGGEFQDMPFNGQLTFPVELKLVSSKNGPILSRKPIGTLSKLYDRDLQKKDKNIIPGLKGNLAGGLKDQTYHIKAVLLPKSADSFGFVVRSGKQSNGTEIRYETAKKILDVNGVRMPLETINGKIELEILIDRASIEVFCNNGTSGVSTCFTPVSGNDDLGLYTQGGELFVESLDIRTVKSAWTKNK